MTNIDIAIVGAGPAGLSAALYAARFCRRTLVFHDGRSRAARIPLTHNVPGFPAGVAGPMLLDRMQGHAERYGAQFIETRIAGVRPTGAAFELADEAGRTWAARALILATGVELHQIPLPDAVHEAAIRAGVLRYCPICDGFEYRGKRIGVIGCSSSGVAEALFLTGYSNDITVLPRHDVELTASERAELDAAGVRIVGAPVIEYRPSADDITLKIKDRIAPLTFDVIYPALGSTPRNMLLRSAGLALEDDGRASGSAPFGTEISGLFCAGDIVAGLDQISVAMGHGAAAATRAHNWLRDADHRAPSVMRAGTFATSPG